jgi:hypothetical protein
MKPAQVPQLPERVLPLLLIQVREPGRLQEQALVQLQEHLLKPAVR